MQKSGVTVPDVPVWRVGDKWKYAGTFDPTQLVIDSGVEANVGEINGDSITEVLSITERNVDGIPTLVYTVRTTANFDKSGVSLDSFTGTAEIEFTQTEVLRVSDLASLSSDLDFSLNSPLAVSVSSSKLLEILRFPIPTRHQAKIMISLSGMATGGLLPLHQHRSGPVPAIISPHFLHQHRILTLLLMR